MTRTKIERASTEQLIGEYDERIAGRFHHCNLGTVRFAQRQARIDAIVDELGRRADADDPAALAWFEAA